MKQNRKNPEAGVEVDLVVAEAIVEAEAAGVEVAGNTNFLKLTTLITGVRF
jgi:hypothetical protein